MNRFTFGTLNFLTGGFNYAAETYERFPRLSEVIEPIAAELDVFVMCEARQFDANGYRLMHQVERMFWKQLGIPMREALVPTETYQVWVADPARAPVSDPAEGLVTFDLDLDRAGRPT